MSNKREPVSIEQIAISNMYSIEAIVNILVKAGVCSQEEILTEIRIIKGRERSNVETDLDKYRDIFSRIENTIREQCGLSANLFEKHYGRFKNVDYHNMSDNDIYWVIVYVTFYSGMRASIVTEKLPAIRKHLGDYEKVKDYEDSELRQVMADPDIIHYEGKIKGCIVNAKQYDKLIKENGSFSTYLESFGDLSAETTLYRIRADLISRFKFISTITVNHFLMELGIDVLKPDIVICRLFERLRLIDNRNNTEQAIRVGKRFSEATGYPIRYTDIIFAKYGQMGKEEPFGLDSGICLEKNPRCSICGVKEYCQYYSEQNELC